MKAVITDHPFPSLEISRAILSANNIEIADLQTQNPDIIIANARDADAMLVGKARIDENILNNLAKCKIIVRFGTGYDNIDLKAATANGIPVSNVPDFCMDEVSDHALALILAAGRQIIVGHNMVQNGKWRPMPYGMDTIYKMRGRVLGLFSFGRIAKLVAEKARVFGLQCMAFDPFVSEEIMSQTGVKKVDFKDLLAQSDFISLHSLLTEKTANAFDLDAFRAMKSSAWIINTARGGIIREADLVEALDEKLIAGAALDVLDDEPPGKGNPLLGRDNVIITPHMGWMSDKAPESMQRKGVEQAARVLTGAKPTNVVNPEVLG